MPLRAAPALALLALAGCPFAESGEDWTTQVVASGPCYEANLLDGIGGTEELHTLFACLNGTGALQAYAPLDEALDAETRDGAAGLVILEWLDSLATLDLDLAGLVGRALAVLDDPSGVMRGLRIGLELVYGAAWSRLGEDVPLNSGASLDAGVLAPLLETAGVVAGVILDDDLAPLVPVADALRADALQDVAWTLASVGVSTDPTLAGLAERWPDDVADTLARVRDGSNDRWSGASGDSLRDVAGELFTRTGNDGRPVIEHLGDPLRPILADDIVRDRVESALAAQWAAGRLQGAVPQVVHLASVDVDGGALSDGEDSALVALVRLLHDADTEIDCTIDLGFFDVDFSLGNLSVSLLQRFADTDPDTVVSGVDLLGGLLGFALTDALLDTVADSGVCPVIDAQLVSDLHAVDRFNDDEVGDLLYVLLAVLDAVDAQSSRIPEVVDLVGTIHAFELVGPAEELLRDAADSPAVDDLVGFVPVLLDPWAYHDGGDFPEYVEPLDFDTAWGILDAVLAEDDAGDTQLGRLSGVLNAFLTQDGAWTALDHLGDLLGDPDAEVRTVLGGLAPALADDPLLDGAHTLADALGDESLARPPLVLVESDGVRDAVLVTELTAPGPLPFSAALVRDGSFEVLLETLRLLATLLPDEDPS